MEQHKNTINRKLTTKERDEFKGTSLLQRKTTIKEKEPKFEDFKMIMVIGRGAFGRVYLAELPG